MNKIVPIALLIIAGLGYLAMDPTPVARLIYDSPHEWRPMDMSAIMEGAEAGDPFQKAQLGMAHWWGEGLPEGITPDPAYGKRLVREALDAGAPNAGIFWFFFIERTRDGMQRAARAGTHAAINLMAMEYALTYCDDGALPEGAMAEFLEPYLTVMDPARQASFVPKDQRQRFLENAREEYKKAVDGTLVKLPAAFDEVCADQESMRAMLPEE